MGILDPLTKLLKRRNQKIIPTVERERYNLEGTFFDPEKLFSIQRRSSENKRKEAEDSPLESGKRSQVSFDSGTSVLIPQRDPGKRQRIFVVSGVIVLFVFGLRTWGIDEWGVRQMLEVALASSLLTYFGLMWAYRFELSRFGYWAVLPLPTLFVFSTVLFVELFFFAQFQRIYEAVLFVGLLGVFMGGLVIAFLTANILNVATIRKIPLLQVAHTSSYVITLFTTFFLGFFLVSLGANIYFTVVLLAIAYFGAVFLHLSHFGFRRQYVIWYSIAISLLASTVAFVMMLWPVETIFRVLLPTIACYVGIGLVMHDAKKIFRTLINWEYVVIILIVLAIIITSSVWGISGKAWM